MKDDGGRAIWGSAAWELEALSIHSSISESTDGTSFVVVTDVLSPLEYAVTQAQGMQDLSFQIYSSFFLWC